jgi:hypothetical protein
MKFWIVSGVVLFLSCFGDVGVRRGERALEVKWLWLTHHVPYEDIVGVWLKREFLGGRLTVLVRTGERLVLIDADLSALGTVVELVQNRARDGDAAETASGTVLLPWWLRSWRARQRTTEA